MLTSAHGQQPVVTSHFPCLHSQPAPGPESSLAAMQELAQLSSDLTRLHLEEVNFHLVSAEDGVGLTRWRVRAVSQDADAEICIKYDVTKDEVRI